jgi:hypothetical protein
MSLFLVCITSKKLFWLVAVLLKILSNKNLSQNLEKYQDILKHTHFIIPLLLA